MDIILVHEFMNRNSCLLLYHVKCVIYFYKESLINKNTNLKRISCLASNIFLWNGWITFFIQLNCLAYNPAFRLIIAL